MSSKFQVVIPKRIRDKLGLSPGQKLQAILYGDRIELIPMRSIKEMRGFPKGIATTIERGSLGGRFTRGAAGRRDSSA